MAHARTTEEGRRLLMFGLVRSGRLRAEQWQRERDCATLQERLDAIERWVLEVDRERAYWRTRCERLLDAALARKGEIHEPTMQDVPKAGATSGLAGLFTGLAHTEIDSSKSRAGSPTSTPGQAVSAGGK